MVIAFGGQVLQFVNVSFPVTIYPISFIKVVMLLPINAPLTLKMDAFLYYYVHNIVIKINVE